MKKILETRDRITKAIAQAFPKRIKLEGKAFQRALDIFRDNLGIPTLDRDTLEDSMMPVLGEAPTAEQWKTLAHRLAGNAVRLRNRRHVLPWSFQRFDEWVPIQVMGLRYARNGRGELGVMLTLKIMAGTPCPKLLFQFWSLKKCRFMSKHLGFERHRGRNEKNPLRFPYESPRQLVTLRFLALIDTELSEQEPYFAQIEFSNSTEEWNRGQIKRRARLVFECPKQFPLTLRCHNCPIGYLTCPAGTHAQDYEIKPCPKCGEQQAFFDKELPDTMCIDCHIKHVYTDR